MLTTLQERITRVLAATMAEAGFALAGGAALIAAGVIGRATRDLDYFATSPQAVDTALGQVEAVLAEAGLGAERLQQSRGFARILVTDRDERCLVDLGYDSRLFPPDPTERGPVLALEELAADKVLALFHRAEARDYVDVHALSRRLDRQRLLELAVAKDPGFDPGRFAEALGAIGRLDPADFETDPATLSELRNFFATWSAELAHRDDRSGG